MWQNQHPLTPFILLILWGCLHKKLFFMFSDNILAQETAAEIPGNKRKTEKQKEQKSPLRLSYKMKIQRLHVIADGNK